jgi:hypothetical protein
VANTEAILTCILTSGTTAASWDYQTKPTNSVGTGTGQLVRATSATLVTPTIGAASATSLAFSSTTGIIGTTTNDSAAAGSVGETINSTVSGVAITSGVQTNVTSISLTAGDWYVAGGVTTTPAGTTTTQYCGCGINTTSATLPAEYELLGPSFAAAYISGSVAIPKRISISGTTTVYLVGYVGYSVSTLTIKGNLTAWRTR